MWDIVAPTRRRRTAQAASGAAGTAIIKIFAKCAPNQQWGVQRDLLERGTAALREAGVPGPVLGPFGAPKA